MNVRYRARALEDVHAIRQWRTRQSTDVAEKVGAAIFAAADWLGEHPKLGTKTDEANARRWPMTDFRYTIFYLIDREGAAIDVLRIMDATRVRDLKRVPK
jgi:plasmid stabilization system protein ParE